MAAFQVICRGWEMNKVMQLLLGNPEAKALERRHLFVFISSALLAFSLLVPVLLPQDIASSFRWIGVLTVASVVYAWRYLYYSLNRKSGSKRKWFNLALLYAALLPFVYLSTGLAPEGNRLPISRWIGDPIWCFLVPTVSFYFGEIRMHNSPVRSERVVHGIHSVVEVFVCLPAWTFIWFFIQTKIGWISV